MNEQKKAYTAEQQAAKIDFFIHEAIVDRLMRIIRCLVIVIVALILLFGGYVFYQSQYETIVIEQDAQTDSGTALLNGTGELRYNGNESPSENSNPGEENQQLQSDQNMPQM